MSEDDDAVDWMGFVTQAWEDELSDSRQDIYSLTDGVPIDSVDSTIVDPI